MPDYKNEPEGIEELMPWSDMIIKDAGLNQEVEAGAFYFNNSRT